MKFDCDTSLPATWRDTPNFQPRRNSLTPSILLMHYTGMASAAAAIDHLCSAHSNVSCHYIVDEAGHITQMVPEKMRAWHAGQGHWAGLDDVNSASIGIEIVNPGHDLGYPDFAEKQIRAVIDLSKDILSRHPILPQNIIGHSDIAPCRKKDPGEKFPWQRFHQQGIGHWIDPAPLGEDLGWGPGDHNPDISRAKQMLAAYGYMITQEAPFDQEMSDVLIAFQRHFRPEKVDGRLDRSSFETLKKLTRNMPISPTSQP